MPNERSFGKLCQNAIELACGAARARGEKFSFGNIGPIIQQLYEAELPVESPKISKEQQTELFNALCLACGINPLEVTRAIKATVAVALADIRSVSPKLTADDIRTRADLFKRKHRDWTLTAPTLAKYWGELGPANGMTFAAKQEFAPPKWKEALSKIYHEDPATASYLAGLGWDKLGKDIKAAINKRLEQPS